MAKVFSGKVMMKLTPESLEAMEKAAIKFDEEKAPLRKQMDNFIKEFNEYLLTRGHGKKDACKICMTASLFSDFIYFSTDVLKIEEVTKGMANSYFRRWYNSKVLNDKKNDYELKSAMYMFFIFLTEEKKLKVEKVLKSFTSPKRSMRVRFK
jgi:hypothetical protein